MKTALQGNAVQLRLNFIPPPLGRGLGGRAHGWAKVEQCRSNCRGDHYKSPLPSPPLEGEGMNL